MFNLVVAALVFALMLAFAVWVVASAFASNRTDLVRLAAGILIGAAALTLLATVLAGWRSREPFRDPKTVALGMALFCIGASVLVAG